MSEEVVGMSKRGSVCERRRSVCRNETSHRRDERERGADRRMKGISGKSEVCLARRRLQSAGGVGSLFFLPKSQSHLL